MSDIQDPNKYLEEENQFIVPRELEIYEGWYVSTISARAALEMQKAIDNERIKELEGIARKLFQSYHEVYEEIFGCTSRELNDIKESLKGLGVDIGV